MHKCLFKQGNTYKCLLDGHWIESKSKATYSLYAPKDNSKIGNVQAIQKDEISDFFKSAQKAQKSWKNIPLTSRADIIHKAADILNHKKNDIATFLIKEIAKNQKSAISEIERTVDFLHYTAEEGKRVVGESLSSESFPGFGKDKISIVERVPLGVVLAIAPFNYPINLSASKIAPALIAGNSVIFKPPTQGAISALYLAQVFCEAGIPAGVLNVITGRGSEIGDDLIKHPLVNMINFTGSSQVGLHISKISSMVPLLLELGGKDAAIVLPDADLDTTAVNIIKGAFSYSGQRCTAVKRILVLDSIADELIQKIVPLVNKLTVGNPEDDSDITPLINTKAADFVQSLINDALEKGAKPLNPVKRINNLIYPIIFDNVTTDMLLAWEEPFGPVLPIIRVKSVEEAISIANQSEYGLQSSIFTQDIDQAFNIARKLEVGTVQINNKTERGPDHFPFSGIKSSGLGTQGIKYSIEAMTRPKAIVLNLKNKR